MGKMFPHSCKREKTMMIENGYANNILELTPIQSVEAGGKYKKVESATTHSGDTVEISDEAKKLFSEMIHKYDGGSASTASEDQSAEEGAEGEAGGPVGGAGGGGSSDSASDVETIKKQIQSLKSQMASLASQAARDGDGGSNSAMISALQAQIAALESQLSAMEQG